MRSTPPWPFIQTFPKLLRGSPHHRRNHGRCDSTGYACHTTSARLPATPIPGIPSQDSQSHLEIRQGLERQDFTENFSRCRGCSFSLGKPIRTQRTLPASTFQIVDSVCAAILGRLKDGQLSLESRRVFLAMALCMPRWLWPGPPKPQGTALAPRSRPRLLQAQAQLFHDGEIGTLLLSLQPETEEPQQQHLPPRTPGHLTHADCHRLLQAGKQGRLTTAWKQLFSLAWRVATPTLRRRSETNGFRLTSSLTLFRATMLPRLWFAKSSRMRLFEGPAVSLIAGRPWMR